MGRKLCKSRVKSYSDTLPPLRHAEWIALRLKLLDCPMP